MTFSSRTITSSLKHLGYGAHPRPRRDWSVLLTLWITALLISVASNLYFFHTATLDRPLGDGIGSEEASPLSLDRVRTLFEVRAAERSKYLQGYAFSDPSRY